MKRTMPTLRFIDPYYDHPGYIAAMRDRLHDTIDALDTTPDHVVITFHGIPRRYIETGDPYRQQCERTADLLSEAMGWRDDQWSICFQSRFGPEQWLAPYTDETLTGLHARGITRPLVFSPGFVTDCLETLDELGNEGRHEFVAGGGDGGMYTLVPCLNAHPSWLDTMANLIADHAGGWVGTPARAATFA
jgi:protoporphyrin/coproporphyrin ferrochelatase